MTKFIKVRFLTILTVNLWLLLALVDTAYAAPKSISFDLHDVPLTDFAQAAIKGLMNSDYIITPELSNENRQVTLQITDKTPEEALAVVLDTLNTYGIEIEQRGDIKYLKKINTQLDTRVTDHDGTLLPSQSQSTFSNFSDDVFIYKPKYRNIDNYKTLFQNLQLKVTGDADFLVISGQYKLLNMAKMILRQYDRPYDDIHVKVSVVEYLDNSSMAANLFSALSSKNIAINIGTQTALTNSLKVFGSTFSIVMSALSEDNRFNILNTSHIRLINGKEGRINVGNEVPVLTQLSQTNNGQPVQNIEYRNSGLILTITPTVTNNFVLADVHQQLSNFVQTTTSNINSPTLTKRELKTVLSSKIGEVVIIGGLDSTQETKTTTSLLGIPLGQTKKTDTSSIFIVLEFNRT